MTLALYSPPPEGQTLGKRRLGDINDAISFEYEKFFCGVGTFTLEISPASVFADKIAVNTLIYSNDDEMCWVVKNVKTESDKITVTGYDLNCLLLDRLTMPTETGEAGTENKDAVMGSTEYCVKHFVEYNLIDSEMEERNIPHLCAAENLDRGIPDDTYLASKECLEDVVRTMCARAELGYRISLDFNTDGPGANYLVFDVMEQRDCTVEQNERNRVVFSAGMRNIGGIEREIGVTAEKNALWCDVSGLNGFINADDDIPSGWERREEYVSLSVTDPYNQQFVTDAARQEMADKFALTDSLTVDAGNPLDYGTVYNVGDVVTVYDNERSAQLNSVISAAAVKRTATEYTVKLTLGEAKPKLLDGLARKSDLASKYQRDFPATDRDKLVSNGGYAKYSCNSYQNFLRMKSKKGGMLNVTSGDYFDGCRFEAINSENRSVSALDVLHVELRANIAGLFVNGDAGINNDKIIGISRGNDESGPFVFVKDNQNVEHVLYFDSVVTEEYVTNAISSHNTDESAHAFIQNKIRSVQNSIHVVENRVSELESGGTSNPSGGYYTTKIAFNERGFDLTFADRNGKETVNSFTVTEKNGKITKITNTTAGREIEVTYE
ncbi:MAG: hypothetical protein HDT42_06315 [Ruminococcaceae bacterium]|nr:hypothetical protein [Oscillospiraceae bacterium]